MQGPPLPAPGVLDARGNAGPRALARSAARQHPGMDSAGRGRRRWGGGPPRSRFRPSAPPAPRATPLSDRPRGGARIRRPAGSSGGGRRATLASAAGARAGMGPARPMRADARCALGALAPSPAPGLGACLAAAGLAPAAVRAEAPPAAAAHPGASGPPAGWPGGWTGRGQRPWVGRCGGIGWGMPTTTTAGLPLAVTAVTAVMNTPFSISSCSLAASASAFSTGITSTVWRGRRGWPWSGRNGSGCGCAAGALAPGAGAGAGEGGWSSARAQGRAPARAASTSVALKRRGRAGSAGARQGGCACRWREAVEGDANGLVRRLRRRQSPKRKRQDRIQGSPAGAGGAASLRNRKTWHEPSGASAMRSTVQPPIAHGAAATARRCGGDLGKAGRRASRRGRAGCPCRLSMAWFQARGLRPWRRRPSMMPAMCRRSSHHLPRREAAL